MAGDRTRRRTWTLSMAGVALLIILYLTTGIASGLRSAANVVITPFTWTVNEVARPVGHLLSGALNYSDVVAQNKRLRYQLGQAQLQINENSGAATTLGALGKQLNLPFVGNLATVVAQVTATSPTSFSATIDISKGSDDGVLAGMPVVANGGLIGSVLSTTHHGATVRLISDPGSSLGVTFGNGASSVVVTGRGVNNGLGASLLPLSTVIAPGTLMITDGLAGGLFPPGIPVAHVTRVLLNSGSSTYGLSLTPTADLRHLSYLDVLLWEPST